VTAAAALRGVAVVAARNEADRVVATVLALRSIPGIERVVVADDGSSDRTAAEALAAGARVVRSERNAGKGAALEAALSVALADDAAVVLLADGDLGATASSLEAVLGPVVAGRADLAIAVPPRPVSGGFGLVRSSAAWLIHRTSGHRATAPLSGQRAATAECLRACRPLAGGFGVDAAMVADAARLGFRVVEVPVAFEHRSTGRDLAGFRHRGRQGADILRALVLRTVGWR
jgi:glycosyltransferase involved in cell wall biosynthesis